MAHRSNFANPSWRRRYYENSHRQHKKWIKKRPASKIAILPIEDNKTEVARVMLTLCKKLKILP